MMTLNRDDICTVLPHRGTMLMVDRVTDIVSGEWAVAEYDVSIEAHWVSGHFPEQPVMPGVLIVEALAQTAALAFLFEKPELQGSSIYLVGLNRFKFRRPVVPGETLVMRAEISASKRGFVSFKVAAMVNDERVANGELLATMGTALQA
jgi:3-hydroxyacyl-[acyl-carrier-protein] dehydratase